MDVSSDKTEALMVLNTSETAAIGDGDGTSMKLDAGKRSKMLGVEWMSQIVMRMGREAKRMP